MNISTIKKASARQTAPYSARFGIKRFGADNLFPQELQKIIRNSTTGATCLLRYARFIEGDGFANEAFAAMEVNKKGETPDDLCALVSSDLASFGGFALHCNYNVFGEVVDVQHVPFELCRLEEESTEGRVLHIKVHADWVGEITRNGKRVSLNEENVTTYSIFDPEKVIDEIEFAGGIDEYKGQILYYTMSGAYVYPLPKYEAALTDLSTDEGLSNVKYRNTRTNFLPAGVFYVRSGQTLGEDDHRRVTDQTEGFFDSLEQFQGDESVGTFLMATIDNEEEKPSFEPFPIRNLDKDFSVTAASTTENIYAAFEQEPFYCIRTGRVGFGGAVLAEAYSYYNSIVKKERRLIERAFDKIFHFWANNDIQDTRILPKTIRPLKYESNGNS